MDRLITNVGESIYEWMLSKPGQSGMVAMAKLAAAMFGTSNATVNGLSCVPTGPASMQVVINPGEIYQAANLEATACGTLPADTSHTVLKQGILLDAFTTASGALAAPGTAGQSINYLIEVQYADSDVSVDPTTGTTPVVLQFYNASNPTQPWSGPNNTGATSNTFRKGVVSIQVKAGTAATTGTQTTPSPDAGWVGLWVVTVANGQSTIIAGNIVAYNGAPALPSSLLSMIQAAPAVVGQARNAKMSVTAASASGTFTADEIIVESALGGQTYKLASFSKAVNLATTGAGGMDTGSAPTNGFVALYAIYNPTTSASALLATNATSAVQPEVYGGANMPAGYTASALVSVWPTNGSGQLKVAFQRDRRISFAPISVYSSSTTIASYTSISVTAIPKNSITAFGTTQNVSTATTGMFQFLASDANGTGEQGNTGYILAGTGGAGVFGIDVITAQTLYIRTGTSSGTPTFNVNVNCYTF